MAAQTTDGTGIELVIETVAISKGNSVAEIFATEAELLAANRNDGAIGYAQDTQLFYFRADNTWSPTGGAGVQIYATEADILGDAGAAAGTIAYAMDADTYYFKKSTEWQALAVGGGEANLGGNVGTGQQIYRTKSGVTLQFRSLTAASGKVSVTQNDLDVSLDVVPGNIQHQLLAGVGTNTHAQIDSQLSDFADHAADVTIHRSIDDSGTSNTDLFSAAHILSELALKRDTATLIDHEVDVSHVGVNTHDEIDAGLADSAAHIADTTLHHTVDDASTSTGTLWSSEKTSDELALKADDSAVVHNTGTETISGAKAFSDPVDLAPTNTRSVGALSCGDPGTGLYGLTGGSLFGFSVQGNGLVEMKALSGYGTDKVVQFFGDMAMGDGGYGVTQLILRASYTPPTSPVTAGLYYDNNTNTPRYWDGSAWQSVGGSGGASFPFTHPMVTTAGGIVTLNAAQSGTFCRTSGGGSYVLPAATGNGGVYFIFSGEGGGAVTVAAAGSDIIYFSTSSANTTSGAITYGMGASSGGGTLSGADFPASITLISHGMEYWTAIAQIGAWTAT